MGMLKIPINNRLIEGHPIGISKIIKGDLREKQWESNGTIYTQKNTDGMILYDRSEPRHRQWFLLVYESGKRVVE